MADEAEVTSVAADVAARSDSTMAESLTLNRAMVAVSVDMQFVGPAPDRSDAAHEEAMLSVESALHEHLERQKAAIAGAAIESMTGRLGPVDAEVRVMRGSIEILVVLSFALGLLRSYNEVFEVVETATLNTRRLVERFADAFLVQPTGQVEQGWHAATTASWWLAPPVVAASGGEPAAAAGGPAAAAARPPLTTLRLPAVDFRAVVLWVVGVITFLTALYVAASILLELFAD